MFGLLLDSNTGLVLLVPVDRDPESVRGGVIAYVIRLLHKAFLPDILAPEDIFMQDNALVHTIRVIKEFLERIAEQIELLL